MLFRATDGCAIVHDLLGRRMLVFKDMSARLLTSVASLASVQAVANEHNVTEASLRMFLDDCANLGLGAPAECPGFTEPLRSLDPLRSRSESWHEFRLDRATVQVSSICTRRCEHCLPGIDMRRLHPCWGTAREVRGRKMNSELLRRTLDELRQLNVEHLVFRLPDPEACADLLELGVSLAQQRSFNSIEVLCCRLGVPERMRTLMSSGARVRTHVFSAEAQVHDHLMNQPNAFCDILDTVECCWSRRLELTLIYLRTPFDPNPDKSEAWLRAHSRLDVDCLLSSQELQKSEVLWEPADLVSYLRSLTGRACLDGSLFVHVDGCVGVCPASEDRFGNGPCDFRNPIANGTILSEWSTVAARAECIPCSVSPACRAAHCAAIAPEALGPFCHEARKLCLDPQIRRNCKST